MAEPIEFALMRNSDGEEVAVDPAEVAAKKLLGWDVIGVAEVDAKGVILEITGRVIETPAHTIETADGFLRVIPEFKAPEPEVPPLVVPVAAKAEEKPKK